MCRLWSWYFLSENIIKKSLVKVNDVCRRCPSAQMKNNVILERKTPNEYISEGLGENICFSLR